MYESSSEDTAPRALPRASARRPADARRAVRALVVRYFFGSSAVIAGITALVFTTLASGLSPGQRLWLVGAFAALAVVALLCLAVREEWVEGAMFGLMAQALVTIAGSAMILGWGLLAPGFAFYALFVAMLCVATSRRFGLALAAVAVICIVAVHVGAPPQPPGAFLPSGVLRLATSLLLVAVGLSSGLAMAYVVSRYVRSADDREERFRGLLAIAADAYWEIDRDYRLVTAADQRDDSRSLTAAEGLGQAPWDLPQFGCDSETLDVLLADLDNRVPFRDRAVQWTGRTGRLRAFLICGEPRFDERGVFKGYWGVARDVTVEVTTHKALTATETRYQALFARIPTPLVLHRHSRVIDANPAALKLFAFDELEAMIGRDLLASYESGDSRERERRRLDELDASEPGTALPVSDFRLLLRNGRRLSVRGTGVRVQAPGGAATLSIYVDDTERRAAEEAVRRSEALLSHLVATSPDLITLTDLASGRYAMVNRTFERLTGYSAAEVVGRTSLELGVWQHNEDRQRFIADLQQRGTVTDMPTAFKTKAGGVVAMLVSGARFVMDRRDYLVINARDVSEAERSRLEREAILENASIGIAVTRDRRFVLANPRFEQMFGWPPGGLVGQPGSAVWPDEASYAEVGSAVGPALARGEQVEFERPARRRDGSSFLARLLAKAIDPHQAVQGGTIWIVEDVTERRQFETALAAARDAAEDASRAKSAFLANTSHELRTPLNGMLHLALLARDPGLDAPRRQQYLDQIADSAQSLAGIISDILDLSKIEAGGLQVEKTPFQLGDLLRAIQRAYATLAAARNLALELDLGPATDGTVSGDPLRVRQLLSNYLNNALKFTAAGRVCIVARRLPDGRREHGERVRFEVHDTGPGITLETQSLLFRPFMQADQSTTRRFGGTGLGLSICRELARLMGGEVGVRSQVGSEDGGTSGSVFWAELPLPHCQAPAGVPVGADVSERQLRGARVLLVEDNPVNMLIAVALLERWGIVVEQASDGHQALQAVQRAAQAGRDFDAVLMDVQMPVMSGYEATKALRLRDVGRRLPIIALTAAAMVTEREAALAAGMDDFLTKPIDADKLRDTLSRWVTR